MAKSNILRILLLTSVTLFLILFSGCSADIRNKDGDNGTAEQETEGSTSQRPGTLPVTNNTGGDDKSGGSSGTADETGTGGDSEQKDDYDKISRQIAEMTLDEKIGQVFTVGFEGYEQDNQIEGMIKDYHVGGVILFRKNIKSPVQLLGLVNSLKSSNSNNKTPLFVSVDEEGGRVTRLPDQIIKLPSNEKIGKINNGDFSFSIGNILAEELKAFGFNMDFAPVLDIFSNPKNTVIGDRSFGNNAEIVSKLGVQTMKGIRDLGVIPVVKHFPGHGDTLEDSHVGLPSVDHDMERLETFELIPFKAAIDSGVDAVMVAHILLRKIDSENPASLSEKIISGILREKMGFEGVVITDDMTMGAIGENYSMQEAVVRSFLAGSDMILVCHGYDNQLEAIKALKAAVQNGTVTEDRLDESVRRILALKDKYSLADTAIEAADVEGINKKIEAVLSKYGIMYLQN